MDIIQEISIVGIFSRQPKQVKGGGGHGSGRKNYVRGVGRNGYRWSKIISHNCGKLVHVDRNYWGPHGGAKMKDQELVLEIKLAMTTQDPIYQEWMKCLFVLLHGETI